ncbi:phosphoenolpyruvate carboxylase [Sinomicrobium weinanense]|uniref:Phosphoenolpyruvate carboxylase n=1 Tax=Sinomicrobium weinanense TaxID=2842200 RepID=A0A926JVW6_9FLAO|nr:phosphoenolpyruvate carboxylase [Sinomicrobium weinanense]MBC9798346.1 phosphoenolpyruvate carboxylase [Sinomicrobium weinanense]MBU3122507.1 phosphoenolpyruvate carboxylase [Sinomicrobium weinanense]
MLRKPKIERFNESVLSKYQIYNSILMTLPFDEITNTGVLLPLFSEICEKGYDENKNPSEIVEAFFSKFYDNPDEEEKNDLLFRFIQYIERQVVLFDAIEDAAFPVVNNMDGRGTLRSIKEEAEGKNKTAALREFLQRFKVRPVLTAHPTQFYPGPVLGIITDLTRAIRNNDLALIEKLLAQLGKTPFFKKEKPTPYDEAVSLIWFLENVFYHAVSKIYNYIQNNIFEEVELNNQIVNLGFWPGGDRDGNPFVNSETTLRVAERLRITVLKNYYRDIRRLKRRITFKVVDKLMADLEQKVYESIYIHTQKPTITAEEMLATLQEIKNILVNEHQSLFVEEINDLINKVKIFGFYFASLDIRQDSRVHHTVISDIIRESRTLGLDIFPDNYESLSDKEQVEVLGKVNGKLNPELFKEEITRSTLESIYAIKEIQKSNGELGANRYIISNNGSELNVMETFAMIRLCDWKTPTLDVVPLFETVDDLQIADKVMENLYTDKVYAEHLKKRGNKQTIMLGFSDGTKDGGYLMANWSIYKAKEVLTEVSRKYGIKVVFFDGRGGPPARGGGKTHQFYASLGPTIENEEVQLTVQGQTISSNFGTLDSCQYNLEQLLSSGVVNEVFADEDSILRDEDKKTMEELADISYDTYVEFKKHPKFLPYLEEMSTLKYYAKTNIGSRPSKRGKSDKLDFSALRAIPFVGSWSQLKQNVPGFYGVGTAIAQLEKKGEFEKVRSLYRNSAFFRTLLENSMMSLTKSFFKLTAYMKDDPVYGEFWSIIYEEYLLSKEMILKVTGDKSLMQNTRSGKASIEIREKIVLPLLTIQQYALRKIQELRKEGKVDTKQLDIYEKMVMRSLFGNINASRNSA